MKSFGKWKKIFFIILSGIVMIRIGYIFFHGEVSKQYRVDTSVDISDAVEKPCKNISQIFTLSHNNLNKIELILNGIADDKKGAITLQILKENKLIYQTNVALANINNREWKQIYTNIPIEKDAEYELKIETVDEYTRVPNVLYSDGKLAVQFGYLASPGRLDKIVNSSIWILLLIIVYIFLDNYESIKNKIEHVLKKLYKDIPYEVICFVAEMLFCMVIIYCSEIEFQHSTKILMYIISICASYKLRMRSQFIASKILLGTPQRIGLYGLYFYCAFALVGQRMLIYPLNISITTAKIFVIIIAVLWWIPVVNSIIYILSTGYRYIIVNTDKKRFNKYKLVGLLAVLLLLPAAYQLFAYNPGISSPDTAACMVEFAKNLHGMSNWHPAFYCMILKIILTIWDSTYAVIFVQYFFWGYVMIEFFWFIRSKGICDCMIICIAMFCGINAGNITHLNTIWKDIPYTLSLLWALVIFAKLLMDEQKYLCKWYIYLELIVSLVGIFFYRKNGMVSYMVIVLMLAVILKNNKKVWGSLAISVLFIGCIKGPIYQHFDIQETGRYGMYIGLSQDILGVYYYDGELSEQTIEMVNVMTNYNNAEYVYRPTWSYQSYELDVEPLSFIRCYVDTFIKNPILMTRAVIARGDAIWDIFIGQDSILENVNETTTMDEYAPWAEIYPKRVYRSLYNQISMENSYTASNQWISAIEWRCGVFSLLGVITLYILIVRYGVRYVLLAIPAVGHILSLLLSTGWSSFRYFWPLNLLNLYIFFLALILMQEKGVKE